MALSDSLTLRQVEAFLAVVRHRKFAAAAAELHVSAPHLSQMIKQLERTVGCALLERTTRSVEVTAAGTVFATLAEHGVAELERAAMQARHEARPPRESLQLGYTIG